MTREEIKRRLEELAKSEPPEGSFVCAMCYSPPLWDTELESATYHCSRCGAKTIYAQRHVFHGQTHRIARMVNTGLPALRDAIGRIKGLTVEMDEAAFCKQCFPKNRNPQPTLVVRYAGEDREHRVKGITCEDLTLIEEFAEGKDTHDRGHGPEEPLRDRLKRLEQLLGVKATE
jgi:hypothetical protein